jgi:hypothetical protein
MSRTREKERQVMRNWTGLGAALVVVVGLLGACGDDSPSASEQVCNDRADLRDAIDQVKQDVSDGDLGAARDDLSGVTDAYNALKESAADLKSEEADALQPEINSLNDKISTIQDVQSLDDLQTTLSSIGSDIDSIVTSISDALECS